MRSLRDLPAGSYTWVGVKDDQQVRELRAGDETVASLRWTAGFAAEGAEAETADGTWAFERRGLLGKEMLIEARRGAAADYDATGWEGGGALQTGTGGRYRFRPITILSTRWAWVDGNETLLATFLLQRRRILRTVEVVRIERAGQGTDDLPLLTVLGSWLAVLGRRDQGVGG